MYRVCTMYITIYNNLAQDVLHITKTIQRQIQIQIELQMNDFIAANFNLVLLRWPVHDITLNLPRHGEDHQTLNIWTVSDYSKDLDLVHQSVCWRMSLLLVVFLITSDYVFLVLYFLKKKWRHSMSTIYLNWLHNKLDTTSVKLIVQMSGPSSKIGKSSTKEGRPCVTL